MTIQTPALIDKDNYRFLVLEADTIQGKSGKSWVRLRLEILCKINYQPTSFKGHQVLFYYGLTTDMEKDLARIKGLPTTFETIHDIEGWEWTGNIFHKTDKGLTWNVVSLFRTAR